MASIDYVKRKFQFLQLEETYSEDYLHEQLQISQQKLEKKQSFEEALISIKSLLLPNYSSVSPSLRQSICSMIFRVFTILQTRYSATRFWVLGKEFFEEAEIYVVESVERDNIRNCIAKVEEYLEEVENMHNVVEDGRQEHRKYLFEGHLTVDPEPPKEAWEVAWEREYFEHRRNAARYEFMMAEWMMKPAKKIRAMPEEKLLGGGKDVVIRRVVAKDECIMAKGTKHAKPIRLTGAKGMNHFKEPRLTEAEAKALNRCKETRLTKTSPLQVWHRAAPLVDENGNRKRRSFLNAEAECMYI